MNLRQARNNEIRTETSPSMFIYSLCRKGFWDCEVATEKRDHTETLVEECGINEIFAQCVDRCAPTCDSLSEVPDCDHTICSRGRRKSFSCLRRNISVDFLVKIREIQRQVLT